MKVKLDLKADSSYGLFFISYERAGVILDRIATICKNVYANFEEEYRVVGVVTQEEGNGELMHRLDVGKILVEMLKIAENENEEHYILYVAFTGVDALNKNLFPKQKQV